MTLLCISLFFMDTRYLIELIQWKSLFTLTDTGIDSSLPFSLSLVLIVLSELLPTITQAICLYVAGRYNWQFFFTGNLNYGIDHSTDVGSHLFTSKQEGFPEILLHSNEEVSDG